MLSMLLQEAVKRQIIIDLHSMVITKGNMRLRHEECTIAQGVPL